MSSFLLTLQYSTMQFVSVMSICYSLIVSSTTKTAFHFVILWWYTVQGPAPTKYISYSYKFTISIATGSIAASWFCYLPPTAHFIEAPVEFAHFCFVYFKLIHFTWCFRNSGHWVEHFILDFPNMMGFMSLSSCSMFNISVNTIILLVAWYKQNAPTSFLRAPTAKLGAPQLNMGNAHATSSRLAKRTACIS